MNKVYYAKTEKSEKNKEFTMRTSKRRQLRLKNFKLRKKKLLLRKRLSFLYEEENM